MRAITIPEPGGPEVLTLAELPDPELGPRDVLVEVVGAGVNRADVGQRQGTYPPPQGAPSWPGMELSGVIRRIGDEVEGWHAGDKVCALVPGGAYASLAAVDERLLLPVPENLALVDAAAIPEAAATVWSNVVMSAGFAPDGRADGRVLLVHGGASGIGVFAIQLGVALGARVFATVGSEAKIAPVEALGARVIDYTAEDFVEVLRREANGADVILDLVGGGYLQRNIDALAIGGTVAIISNQSGAPGTFDVGTLMRVRGRIQATTLRARSLDERAAILAEVSENVMPLVADGVIVPVVDSYFALEDAELAHRRIDDRTHVGKIILTM